MPSRLNPYLSFRGNAREAMEFYRSVFGGKLDVSTFGEGGIPHDPSESGNLMHSLLESDNGIVIMGADTPSSMPMATGSSVSMSLSGDDEAELSGYFHKLAEGGTIAEPLEKAPWGDTFGMLTDRFGLNWMVNISGRPT